MIARISELKTRLNNLRRRFMLDRAGNIAMSFAIVSVPLLGAMGVGFDYVRALNLHREIEGNLDAALVAAVKDVGTKDSGALKAQLANWLAASAEEAGSYVLDTDGVVIDKTNSGITAKVRANVDTTFLRILGRTKIPISVSASVVSGEDPNAPSMKTFSMYFVFDRSQSMSQPTDEEYETLCYKKNGKSYSCFKTYTKMESLKLATEKLLAHFATMDEDAELIRTGAVSYHNAMQPPTALAWGGDGVSTYVQALTPAGTTNSGEAFKMAYDSLMTTGEQGEKAEHKRKNGNDDPDRYIVFMTDGANNVAGADKKTKEYCDLARAAEIKVYAIAFMAPKEGEALLRYCATTPKEYYEPQNTTGLVSAFKNIADDASKRLIRLTN